jgi:ligand-binding sensor domain-containing protein/DNA-binding CsgD family transcriptional regulator
MCLLCALPHKVTAQHVPLVTNYMKNDFKANEQNWGITISETNGKVFAGNSEGLLAFDGGKWHLYHEPGHKIVRSVLAIGDRVYTGGYESFGYWTFGSCGEGVFQSITKLIDPQTIRGEEIWHIAKWGNEIIFQSFSVLFAYDGKSIRKISLPGSIMFASAIKDHLWIQVIDQGIFTISKSNIITKVPKSEIFNGKIVTGIAPLSGKILISTERHGLYTYSKGQFSPWNGAYKDYFVSNQVNKMLLTSNHLILLGTIRDGLSVFDKNLDLQYNCNAVSVLPNNTVLGMALDSDENLWLGLDRGISYIKISSSFRQFRDYRNKLGSIYTAAKYDDKLYLGTNQGLYVSNILDPNHNNFEFVSGTQGQVWDLSVIDDKLVCGHNEGTFVVNGLSAKKISDFKGGWHISKIPSAENNDYLQGTYNGICHFKCIRGNLKLVRRLEGLRTPVDKLCWDKSGNLWITQPNIGVSQVTFELPSGHACINKTFNAINSGFANNSLTVLNGKDGEIVVSDGIKTYVYHQGRFMEKNHLVTKGSLILSKLPEKSLGSIRDRLSYSVGSYVFTDTSGIVLYENGYDFLNFTSKDSLHPKAWGIETVEFEDLCLSFKNKPIRLPSNGHSPTFTLFDLGFNAWDDLNAYLVSGNDTIKPLLDNAKLIFNNLNAGKYVLQIQHNYRMQSFEVYVSAPWYRTTWAYVFYTIILIGGISLLNQFYKKELMKQKEHLHAENSRLIREHQIEMENQRLAHENLLKSKELANATMHLIQKNEVLEEIKTELSHIRQAGDSTSAGKEMQNIMKKIQVNMTMQDDQHLFDVNFEDVHGEFMRSLKQRYPALSPADVKLAAYLRMNISSKDLAPIFNISLRGLENKRYRLRKKMGLDVDTSLVDFFIQFNNS